jgi:hypothetical protein
MKTLRTTLALLLTLPLYLGSCCFLRHPFSREWEGHLKGLFGK